MGEAVLAAAAKKRGLNIVVDSCGTAGYHVGEDPDDVSPALAQKVVFAYLFPLAVSRSSSLLSTLGLQPPIEPFRPAKKYATTSKNLSIA
jgi:hypothetical protein